jgi:hypothetical protein
LKRFGPPGDIPGAFVDPPVDFRIGPGGGGRLIETNTNPCAKLEKGCHNPILL